MVMCFCWVSLVSFIFKKAVCFCDCFGSWMLSRTYVLVSQFLVLLRGRKDQIIISQDEKKEIQAVYFTKPSQMFSHIILNRFGAKSDC